MTKGPGSAIVGVGTTDFYRRGQSFPRTPNDLAVQAILAALNDAGLSVDEVDGFAFYCADRPPPFDRTMPSDTGWFAQALGIPTIRFSATVTSGGNGSAASVALAAAAVESGQANVVVSVMSLQQLPSGRFGAGGSTRPASPEADFLNPFAVFAPANYFALVAQRHMHQYGTTREHLYEVVSTQRRNALTRPKALFKTALTREDYFNARMLSDPLCLFDFTLESDGAAAVITTSAERARDLRQTPAYIKATSMGGDGRWGRGNDWIGMDDDLFPTAGAGMVASELYSKAGIGPDDIDVAELYDHFSPTILTQLEDFGFCGRGEGGPFVADGNIRMDGKIPVNTHGGNLSEAYIIGMTHVVEAVEQIRGTAINQVPNVEVALATGGPSHMPLGAIILTR